MVFIQSYRTFGRYWTYWKYVFIAVKADHVAEWSLPLMVSDPACIQPPALKYSLPEEGCPGLVISGKITRLRQKKISDG